MGLFDGVGVDAAREIHAMADDAMQKADKLLDKATHTIDTFRVGIGSLVQTTLDRFECECDIHFKIKPPKAQAANPAPESDHKY